MKAGWELKKLKDVCELVNGRAYGKTELLTEGKYRVLRVGNFFTNNHWYYSDLELEDKKYCDHGDLLYAWSASFGPRIWTGEKVIYHYHIWKVIPDPSVIDQRYLFHFFNWDTESIKEDQGAGTTMLHVSKGSMEDRDIQIPPLPEQQHIVTLLDEAFDGIASAKANAEKNLQNARAIFESHLQSVFTQRGDGWVDKSLAEVTTIINGFAFKSGDFSPNAKIQSIKITNVGVREFVCESDSLLPNDFAETYASFAIRAGSIVIALTRTIISGGLKVAVVPDEFDGALLNQRVAAILVRPDLLNAEFLFAYLSSQYVFDYVKAHVNTLMQPNLSINDLRSLPVPVPPAVEQARIAAQLAVFRDETQRLEEIYQQKLTALDELKKSLLHRAFNDDL